MPKTAIAQAQKPAPRPRGRPARNDASAAPVVTRETVLQCAVAMTRSERLDALSMVRVASAMGVSPSLLHYYLDSRDALTSGVINVFFRSVCEATPPIDADPRKDIENVAWATYTVMCDHPGVVDYLAAHNRYRLVQKVEAGEIDYGVRAFERLAAAIMRAGYAASDAALLGHLIRMLVLSSAQSEAHFQTPGFHKRFLDDTLERFDRGQYPGLHHSLREFAALQGKEVFDRGLGMLLDGFTRAGRTRKRS
jgi:AcrR family transcriptional regulator